MDAPGGEPEPFCSSSQWQQTGSCPAVFDGVPRVCHRPDEVQQWMGASAAALLHPDGRWLVRLRGVLYTSLG